MPIRRGLVLLCLIVLTATGAYGLDGSWEIVGSIDGLVDPTGITFDGTWIWATEQHAGNTPLHRINPSTLIIEETIRIPEISSCCVQGLAWDGQYIWISGNGYAQYRFEPLTGEIIHTCTRPSNPQPIGLTVVDGTVYATGWYGSIRDCDLMSFDPHDCSYEIITSLPSVMANGVAWTGDCFLICMRDHADPPSALRRTLYKYSRTGEQLTRYEKFEFHGYGIVWDGDFVWVCDYGRQFVSDGKIYKVKLLDSVVHLDIKPGSCPNPLNVKLFQERPKNAKSKKRGVLPVAILGTQNLDVSDIDVSTLRLEGVEPLRHNYEDVAAPIEGGEECECTTAGPDGYADLSLKFEKSEIVTALGSVSHGDVIRLTLTGELLDGTPFETTDCVNILCKELEPPTPLFSGDDRVVMRRPVPNPFNPTTRISYELPSEGFVKLSVYDITGRLVEELVSEVRPAGEHVVEWNAHGMASGIYFCRIEVGSFTDTRKLILLK